MAKTQQQLKTQYKERVQYQQLQASKLQAETKELEKKEQ